MSAGRPTERTETMTRTRTREPFTPDIFDRFSTDDRWLGFGYLGARRGHVQDPDDPELDPLYVRRAIVAETDLRILNLVEAIGWSEDDLFTWCNSKDGRHFADSAFEGAAGFDRAVRLGLLRKQRRA